MKRYPPIPAVDAAPAELFDRGHLWIQELVDGELLRFQMQRSGLLRFGDRERVYDEDAVPPRFQYAVRHVRERLDRDALRAAIDDPEGVVFFGVSTHKGSVNYDWERTPGFLGFDVWSAEKEQLLPPDAVEKIYQRLGLDPVNAFRKEVRAADFQLTVDAILDSAWYDGPAAGIVIRNKIGLRASLENPAVVGVDDVEPITAPAEEAARRLVTDRRLERLADDLDQRGKPVTVESLYERALEAVLREQHDRLFHADADLDVQAFRSEVAAITRAFLNERY